MAKKPAKKTKRVPLGKPLKFKNGFTIQLYE